MREKTEKQSEKRSTVRNRGTEIQKQQFDGWRGGISHKGTEPNKGERDRKKGRERGWGERKKNHHEKKQNR